MQSQPASTDARGCGNWPCPPRHPATRARAPQRSPWPPCRGGCEPASGPCPARSPRATAGAASALGAPPPRPRRPPPPPPSPGPRCQGLWSTRLCFAADSHKASTCAAASRHVSESKPRLLRHACSHGPERCTYADWVQAGDQAQRPTHLIVHAGRYGSQCSAGARVPGRGPTDKAWRGQQWAGHQQLLADVKQGLRPRRLRSQASRLAASPHAPVAASLQLLFRRSQQLALQAACGVVEREAQQAVAAHAQRVRGPRLRSRCGWRQHPAQLHLRRHVPAAGASRPGQRLYGVRPDAS